MSEKIRTCKNCGKKFEYNFYFRKYCCKECQIEGKQKNDRKYIKDKHLNRDEYTLPTIKTKLNIGKKDFYGFNYEDFIKKATIMIKEISEKHTYISKKDIKYYFLKYFNKELEDINIITRIIYDKFPNIVKHNNYTFKVVKSKNNSKLWVHNSELWVHNFKLYFN